MNDLALSNKAFQQYRRMAFVVAGINTSDAKKPLVSGRLTKRIYQYDLSSYGDYFRPLLNDCMEQSVAEHVLISNETYSANQGVV